MAQHLVPLEIPGREGWFVRWRERKPDGNWTRPQQQFTGNKAKQDAKEAHGGR